MRVWQKAIKHIFYPLWLLKDGDLRTLRYIKEYCGTEWCENEDIIRERQLRSLKRLLIHAYENTDYYKGIFQEVGFDPYNLRDFSQVEQIPLLTKQIIRENTGRMLANNVKRSDLIKDSTGGSTGVPLVFFRDRDCIRKRKAQELFFDRWMGYEIGEKIALFVAAPHSPGKLKGIKAYIRNATCERLLAFDPYNTTESYMEEFYQRLRAFKPRIIKCFPNSLYIFAKFLESRGYDGIRPDVVSCTGETLYQHQRRLFSDIFRCPVFEKYGSFEHGVLFCECRVHKGLHIFTDAAYVEFLHENRTARPGEIADIVVTDLFNYGMPFIRYKIGDKAIATNRKCSCGSNLPLVEKILGRDRDILVAASGELRPGYLFVEVFNKNAIPGQFQVIQLSLRQIEVKIVPDKDFGEYHCELIREKFKQLLGSETDIKLSFVSEIPREESGKYAYIKSEINL